MRNHSGRSNGHDWLGQNELIHDTLDLQNHASRIYVTGNDMFFFNPFKCLICYAGDRFKSLLALLQNKNVKRSFIGLFLGRVRYSDVGYFQFSFIDFSITIEKLL